MHITEFIGIYLIILRDKINSFVCNSARMRKRVSGCWPENRTVVQKTRSTQRDETGTQRLRG